MVNRSPSPSGFSPVVPSALTVPHRTAKLPAVRVVAGIARGRKLVAPKGDATRPTSDFVREAIFNSLQAHVDQKAEAQGQAVC